MQLHQNIGIKIFSAVFKSDNKLFKKRKVKSINVKTRIDNFASIAVLIKFNFNKKFKKLINENNYYYYLEKTYEFIKKIFKYKYFFLCPPKKKFI